MYVVCAMTCVWLTEMIVEGLLMCMLCVCCDLCLANRDDC